MDFRNLSCVPIGDRISFQDDIDIFSYLYQLELGISILGLKVIFFFLLVTVSLYQIVELKCLNIKYKGTQDLAFITMYMHHLIIG